MRIEVLSWGRKCLVYLRFSCNLCPFFRSFTLSRSCSGSGLVPRKPCNTNDNWSEKTKKSVVLSFDAPNSACVPLCVREKEKSTKKKVEGSVWNWIWRGQFFPLIISSTDQKKKKEPRPLSSSRIFHYPLYCHRKDQLCHLEQSINPTTTIPSPSKQPSSSVSQFTSHHSRIVQHRDFHFFWEFFLEF